MKTLTAVLAATALVTVSACRVNVEDGDNAAAEGNAAITQAQPQQNQQQMQQQAQLQQMRTQARQEMQDLQVVVDLSDRQLRVMRGGEMFRNAPVAVGTEEWPTPTGSWDFHRVDINPEWIPPKEEEWAEDEERKAPGDPENPMGQARLVYRMPNTVHGTNDLNSLGKASSHGSIRVANEVVLQLAEMLLKAGGAWEGDQWFQQMVQNRTEEYQINLPEPIPILVQE